MKYSLLLLSFMLFACGQNGLRVGTQPHPNPGIGPEFTKFVEMFESDYGHSIGNFPITFSAQNGNVVGVCKVWTDGYRQIEIDPTYWNNMNVPDSKRKALIYHELGHCILNRGHDSSTIDYPGYGTIPKTIMNPYLMDAFTWVGLQTYYINELFGNLSVAPLSEPNNNCVQYMD